MTEAAKIVLDFKGVPVVNEDKLPRCTGFDLIIATA